DLEADAELNRWLDDGGGRPVVFFGYDRMPIAEPETVLHTVAAMAEQSGIRAVVAAGDLPLPADREWPASVYVAAAVDYRTLFPRCACAVHHGGAEMTHWAASAGIPSIAVSAFPD